MKLQNKSALVTGASRGIGRETALALASEGAQVILTGRSMDELEVTRGLLADERTLIHPADLRDERQIENLVASAVERFGGVDLLVNCAGVWRGLEGKYHGPRLPETPVSQIDEMIDVNLRASFLLTRLLLPGMMRRQSGKILQLSCGFAGPREAVGWLHYYVVNNAVESFTRGLAAEMRPYNIQVNCIAPWFVSTEAVRQFYPDEARTALTPQDVASFSVFLLSSEADHISGQVIELRSKLDIG